jgi:hypothetical protein
MNCPKCDLQALPNQKFCRSCGASLQMVTRPLAEYAAVSDLERTPVIASKGEHQRTNRLTPLGFIIMFIGVAIGVIGKMLLHQEMLTVIGVLVSLVGMFLTAYPYLSPRPRQKHDSIPSSQPEALTNSQPVKYLRHESDTGYVPSVTERTTTLLKDSAPTSTTKEKESKLNEQ